MCEQNDYAEGEPAVFVTARAWYSSAAKGPRMMHFPR